MRLELVSSTISRRGLLAAAASGLAAPALEGQESPAPLPAPDEAAVNAKHLTHPPPLDLAGSTMPCARWRKQVVQDAVESAQCEPTQVAPPLAFPNTLEKISHGCHVRR
jgi:hypothetical protein